MRDFLDSQIAAKRAKLQELDRQRLTVEAELRAYEEMLGHIVPPALVVKSKSNGQHTTKANERTSMIPMEMTPGWRKILRGLEELGHAFGARDIVAVGDAVGVPTKIQNARGQIYQWDQKNIIQRVRKGKYKLDQKGYDTIRKIEGSDAQAPEPS